MFRRASTEDRWHTRCHITIKIISLRDVIDFRSWRHICASAREPCRHELRCVERLESMVLAAAGNCDILRMVRVKLVRRL